MVKTSKRRISKSKRRISKSKRRISISKIKSKSKSKSKKYGGYYEAMPDNAVIKFKDLMSNMNNSVGLHNKIETYKSIMRYLLEYPQKFKNLGFRTAVREKTAEVSAVPLAEEDEEFKNLRNALFLKISDYDEDEED